VFAEVTDSRYPQISEELLIAANPEVLLLSSEPFPFAAKHIEHFTKILPHTKVLLVDGEMFSWYGSRLLQAPAYFKQLLQEMNN
jgi:ABC-type Fe3+-hydroxamate transport system substrate-binding protein